MSTIHLSTAQLTTQWDENATDIKPIKVLQNLKNLREQYEHRVAETSQPQSDNSIGLSSKMHTW